jgi:type IV secretory pathway VirB4 component
MAMTFLWDEVNRDWRERKILDIDELGILADSEDALQFVWKVSKSARRRQCRLQVATQDPADFLSGRNPAASKYALGIINNCATKVLGYLEPKALEQVAQVVNLSEAELTLISSMFGKPQEKLLIVGEQRAHVEIPASLEELRILDPKVYKERTGRDAD